MDLDEADDLYGDLGAAHEDGALTREQMDACLLPTQFAPGAQDQQTGGAAKGCRHCADASSQLMAAHSELASLKTTLAQKESKLAVSVRQNAILLRNLSLLYATAQAEINKLRHQAQGRPTAQDGTVTGTPPPTTTAAAASSSSSSSAKRAAPPSASEDPEIAAKKPRTDETR